VRDEVAAETVGTWVGNTEGTRAGVLEAVGGTLVGVDEIVAVSGTRVCVGGTAVSVAVAEAGTAVAVAVGVLGRRVGMSVAVAVGGTGVGVSLSSSEGGGGGGLGVLVGTVCLTELSGIAHTAWIDATQKSTATSRMITM